MSRRHMEALSGYEIMELDTGISTENEYWDWALSAGHYSFCLANDDFHHIDNSMNIAVRCNFLCTPSGRYEDLKKTLLGGGFYAMRVPDYGYGDWDVKYEKNRDLPSVKAIGLRGDTVHMTLSEPADSIRVTGQDHRTLALVERCDSIAYRMRPEDGYARLTAFFPEGEVIYSNPFARYDAALADSPFDETPQRVSLVWTILYNLLLLVKVSLAVWSLVLAVFTLVAFHVPFFRHLFANVEAGTNGVVIAVTAALLLLVLDFLLYYLLVWLLRFVGKCIVAFTLFGDAVMLYFVNNYDVLVTDEMMGNVFRTQYSEASGFFSFSFILYILLLCVVPCIYVFRRKVEYGSWPSSCSCSGT